MSQRRAVVQTWAPEPDKLTFPALLLLGCVLLASITQPVLWGSEHLNLWEDIWSAPRGCHCLTKQLERRQGPDATHRHSRNHTQCWCEAGTGSEVTGPLRLDGH